jgi:hypothetical protein
MRPKLDSSTLGCKVEMDMQDSYLVLIWFILCSNLIPRYWTVEFVIVSHSSISDHQPVVMETAWLLEGRPLHVSGLCASLVDKTFSKKVYCVFPGDQNSWKSNCYQKLRIRSRWTCRIRFHPLGFHPCWEVLRLGLHPFFLHRIRVSFVAVFRWAFSRMLVWRMCCGRFKNIMTGKTRITDPFDTVLGADHVVCVLDGWKIRWPFEGSKGEVWCCVLLICATGSCRFPWHSHAVARARSCSFVLSCQTSNLAQSCSFVLSCQTSDLAASELQSFCPLFSTLFPLFPAYFSLLLLWPT